jgi:hypothetical protein
VHKTTVAATVDVVTLAPTDVIMVTNRSGVSPIYFTVDGSVPTVAGDGTRVMPAIVGAKQQRVDPGGVVRTNQATTDEYHPAGTTESAVQVRLISAAPTDYSVEIVT